MRFSKKPDEMEKAISYQAMKITWTIVNVAFVTLLVVAFVANTVNPVSVAFLLVAEAIYLVTQYVLRYNMTKDGREE